MKTLSIVTASGAGGDFLFQTLAALRPQLAAHDAELIVVDRVGDAHRERIRREFPEAKLVACDGAERPSVPAMRALGLDAAAGEIVAVIEEHKRPGENWVRAILDNFQEGDVAIGGPILDDEYTRRRDWVVYFSEYHNYMPPWQTADEGQLASANIAYDRAAVLRHRDVLETGWWEAVLHPALSADGRFRAIPQMGAQHMGPFDYAYYLHQRYLLARAWAATERGRVGMGLRLAHILSAPIFPLFLLGRMTRSVLDKRHLIGQFTKTIPLLVPALFAYTWGEFLGYLVGPGTALENVE
jgi:hypothetical protein